MSVISMDLLPAGISKTFIEPLPLPEEGEPYTSRRLAIIVGDNLSNSFQEPDISMAFRVIELLETKAAPVITDVATLLNIQRHIKFLSDSTLLNTKDFIEKERGYGISEDILEALHECNNTIPGYNPSWVSECEKLAEKKLGRKIGWLNNFILFQGKITPGLLSGWKCFRLQEPFVLLVPQTENLATNWISTEHLERIDLLNPTEKKTRRYGDKEYSSAFGHALRLLKLKPNISHKRDLAVIWAGHGSNQERSFAGINLDQMPEDFINLDELGTRYIVISTCYGGSDYYLTSLQELIEKTHALDNSTVVITSIGEIESRAFSKGLSLESFFTMLRDKKNENRLIMNIAHSGLSGENIPLIRPPHGYKFSLYKKTIIGSEQTITINQIDNIQKELTGTSLSSYTYTKNIVITTPIVTAPITIYFSPYIFLKAKKPNEIFVGPLGSKYYYAINKLIDKHSTLENIFNITFGPHTRAFLGELKQQPVIYIDNLTIIDQTGTVQELHQVVIGGEHPGDLDMFYKKGEDIRFTSWMYKKEVEEPAFVKAVVADAQEKIKEVQQAARSFGKLDPEKARKRIEAIESATTKKKS